MSDIYNHCNPCTPNNVDEINKRILARIMATGNSDVLLSPRPQPTLFTRPLQNIIPSPPCLTRVLKFNTNTANSFHPCSKFGAWSRYTANINTESELRNQTYALQNAPQSVYVPNSTSDLYNPNTTAEENNTNKPTELMKNTSNLPGPSIANEHSYTTFPPIPVNLGNKLFNNHTRQQLKDN